MEKEDKFHKQQKKLVLRCETAHKFGLRHKGLSGAICENLFMDELRKSLPSLRFDRGVIRYAQREGWKLTKEDISSQIDIIIYQRRPELKIIGKHVSVPIKDVLGVIELKKWSFPKMLSPNGSLSKSLLKLGRILKQKSSKDIPVFFVSFRFEDRVQKKRGWGNISSQFPVNSYCFFGRSTRKNGNDLYPNKEEIWNKPEEWGCYKGQYKQLIKDIRAYCR